MFALYKIAGAFAAPPGLFVIILLAMAAVLFLKSRRASRAFGTAASLALFVFAAALCAMSTPAGARFITGPLEAKYAAQLPPDGETAAFLVLAGGSSYDAAGSSVQPSPLALERVYTAVTLASGRAGEVRARHVGRQRLRRQGLAPRPPPCATQRERWAGAAR